MASNLLPITTTAVAPADTNLSDLNRRRSAAVNGGAGKWWTPLFGISPDADYIENGNKATAVTVAGEAKGAPKFRPGGFTEEKAKLLRLRTKESFHDVMYHSAIASRLASDFSAYGEGDRQ